MSTPPPFRRASLVSGCGTFLFALTSSKKPDEILVTALGMVGGVAGGACFASEIYTVSKARSRKRHARSQLEQPGTVSEEDIIEGCSWYFVAASFAGEKRRGTKDGGTRGAKRQVDKDARAQKYDVQQ